MNVYKEASLGIFVPKKIRLLYVAFIFSFNQIDSNKDRLVTLEEFLRATEKKEFLEPDSWEVRGELQRARGSRGLHHCVPPFAVISHCVCVCNLTVFSVLHHVTIK